MIRLRVQDIDKQNKSISIYVLDAWAGSILSASSELTERLSTSKSSVKSISQSSNQNDIELKSLNRYIETVEGKLSDEQKKNSKLIAKIQDLEAKLTDSSGKKKSDEADAKRQ